MIVKRLKAFTLVELIVVMIISIITLTTIYTVYLLVKKQYVKQSGKTESLNDYLMFKNTFSADFNNADSVINRSEDPAILCYSNTSIITYQFSEKTVIRQTGNFIDSFLVFPNNLDISVIENSEMINEISFNIVAYRDTILMKLRKRYDANSLIKIKFN